MGIYNEAMIYGDANRPRIEYRRTEMFKPEQRGDRCIKCKTCLDKCPQKLPIPELLEKVHAFLMA